MLRRFVWTVLPMIALGAGVVETRAVAAAPAVTDERHQGDGAVLAFAPPIEAGDDPLNLAVPAPGNEEVDAFGRKVGGPASDVGLAAAGLAGGPLATVAVPRAGRSAAVATKAKARLPEPATWVMLIGGMYGIGAALRRRHRASEAAFTARVRAIAASKDDDDQA